MKKVVALTGGIGSGKTTAGKFLAQRGFCVIDCDKISAEVACEGQVLDLIAKTFGDTFVADGKLDRRAIAKEVFCSQEKTQLLNAIFHPRIFEVLKQKISEIKEDVIFVEIPLLEKSMTYLFDVIWVFVAQSQRIAERVEKRDGRTQSQVKDIMARQKEYGNFDNAQIVTNDGTVAEFEQKLLKMLENLA